MTIQSAATAGPEKPRLVRGLAISIALAIAFMFGSAVQSAATLAIRMRGNDVMEAASGGVWNGQIGVQIALFVLAQVVLHVAFAMVIWLAAWATVALWPAVRAKFGRMVVLWFALFAAAVIAYNAYWYPRTGLGAYYHDPLASTVGPLGLGQWIYLTVVAAASLVVVAAAIARLRQLAPPHRRRLAAVTALALLGTGAVAVVTGGTALRAAARAPDRPNVILLGIDSLRLGELRRFGGGGVTPHLDAFLAKADVVKDVTTPVARTFPSWVSILTGRSPGVTGARFNLGNRQTLHITPTLGDVLRDAGYHTVYATDEVRFANIDESYGFDQVVTPPIGASDFLIGTYNELPLASVVINSRVGRLLFPFSYGNRGVATLFQPDRFLGRLDAEVSFDSPTLFITHLTASHWPYYVSDTTFHAATPQPGNPRPLYRVGLETADAMFGQIVAMLERKGALENAIVVVLSDHGEALQLPGDSLLSSRSRIEGLRAPLRVSDSGHGQSVLSPVQYQVLLGFRSFGRGAGFVTKGRDVPGMASVQDISPTVLDLLRLPADRLAATGESLAPVLRGDPGATMAGSPGRIRFTETDLKVLPDAKGGVDEVATANQNSKFFEIDPRTGRMHIRDRFAPLIIAFKERAAFDDQRLLVALPAGPDGHVYLMLGRWTGDGRLVMGRPPETAPEERRLWDAMHQEFAGEMQPPVDVTVDDLPAMERGWQDFFIRRKASTDDKIAAAR